MSGTSPAPAAAGHIPGETLDEQFLRCSLCLDRFEEPVLIQCGHSYCRKCLELWYASCDQTTTTTNGCGRPSVTCPTCREPCALPSGGIAKLNSNHYIKSLMDFVDKSKESKRSEALSPASNNCQIHPYCKLLFFCLSCSVPICFLCSKNRHQPPGHRYAHLDETSRIFRDDLDQLVKRARCRVDELEQQLGELRKWKRKLEADAKKVEGEIRAHFGELRSELVQQEDLLVSELSEHKLSEQEKLATEIARIESDVESLLTNTNFTENFSQNSGVLSILHLHSQTHSSLQNLLKDQFPVKVCAASEGKFKETFRYRRCDGGPDIRRGGTLTCKSPQIYRVGGGCKTVTPDDAKSEERLAHHLLKPQRKGDDDDEESGKTLSGGKAPPTPQRVVKTLEFDFKCPSGIVSLENSVFVADSGNFRLGVLQQAAKKKPVGGGGGGSGSGDGWQWTSLLEGVYDPWDVAIDRRGLYLALTDRGEGQCVLFARNGRTIDEVSAFGKGVFKSPRGVAFSRDGARIHVVDHGDNALKSFDTKERRCVDTIGAGKGNEPGQFDGPWFVVVNSRDDIIVSDSGNNRIQIFNKSGILLRHFNGAGTDNGIRFNSPKGVAVDKWDHIYICDTNNKRLVVYRQNGSCICRIKAGNMCPVGLEVTRGSPCSIFISDWSKRCIYVLKDYIEFQ